MEESNSFQPNEKSFPRRWNENESLGLQGTVNHNIMTDNDALKSCCATSAHTPKPANANDMPTMLEGMMEPMLLKKSFLNIMLRAT